MSSVFQLMGETIPTIIFLVNNGNELLRIMKSTKSIYTSLKFMETIIRIRCGDNVVSDCKSVLCYLTHIKSLSINFNSSSVIKGA